MLPTAAGTAQAPSSNLPLESSLPAKLTEKALDLKSERLKRMERIGDEQGVKKILLKLDDSFAEKIPDRLTKNFIVLPTLKKKPRKDVNKWE